ncbi:hypothetical protein BOA8489_03183 [Boseongicola aestuarii]|uniref:Uncharacterized protein n=1 Tax=Boseongicola aestuarii TaxID=1470561 RepID=A0A238J2U0_9RHOB|nr:hypothetical protein BOA8489_03183 [Boseongicola aestuarii]
MTFGPRAASVTLGSEQFSVCVEVKELGYWSFGVVVLSEVGMAAS